MTVVAIDGPAGAGKSTVARAVAERMGYTYVDTGAMYRAVALAALERGIEDGEGVAEAVDGITVESADGKIYLDGRDVSLRIRSADVTAVVSRISAQEEVRARLLALQRNLAGAGDVVMEGRDIGTRVCPEAEVKVFLTAGLEARAHRRWVELRDSGITLEEVTRAIGARDSHDSDREASPLRPAEDAVMLDTTDLTVEQVVDQIETMVRGGRPDEDGGRG